MRMIDAGNGNDFSMRALAKEMGVFPATLYWHVGDRSRLLGLVERRWLDGVTVPDDQPDWREWMHESARRYRAQAHKHPNIARLVTNERARNVNSLTLPDALVGKLAGTRLPRRSRPRVQRADGCVSGLRGRRAGRDPRQERGVDRERAAAR